jgi:PKD repeat protein
MTSFTPMSGPVGTTVDIRGDNLTGATSVKFGNDAATFTVDSDTEIHAQVPTPSGATNTYISVVTPRGSVTAGALFLVKANAPPTAHFTFTCSALTCSVNGSPSSDSDGTIQAYSWSFGDGTSGSGRTTDHTYSQAVGYAVKLTVTDNTGATATETQTVSLVKLTARGYTVKGLERVDLRWNGVSGTSFDVYRNDGKVGTVQAGSYTDDLKRRGAGSYTYKVCAPALSTCSNGATVNF